MTKQGNVTQRTPQAKKQSDHASRQISKQASGSANAPYDLVFTAMGPPLGTTQTTATITSTEGLQRATFTTLPNGARERIHRSRHPPPPSKQGSRAGQSRCPQQAGQGAPRVNVSKFWTAGGIKNKYREDEDEDYVRLWRRQKVELLRGALADFRRLDHWKWHLFFHLTAGTNAVVEPLTSLEIKCSGSRLHPLCTLMGGSIYRRMYEHCFQRLRPEVKSQLDPGHDVVDWLHGRKDMAHGATTITGYGGNKEHSTNRLDNFMGQLCANSCKGNLDIFAWETKTHDWVSFFATIGIIEHKLKIDTGISHMSQDAIPLPGLDWSGGVLMRIPLQSLQWTSYRGTPNQNGRMAQRACSSDTDRIVGIKPWLSQVSRHSHSPCFKTLTEVYERGEIFRWILAAEEPSRSSSSYSSTSHASRTRPGEEIAKVKRVAGEHNISYRPRTAVKGQILADFLIEKPETMLSLPSSANSKLQNHGSLFKGCFVLRVDGSGDAGFILLTRKEWNSLTHCALKLLPDQRGGVEALIAGDSIAARMGVGRNLENKSISEMEIIPVLNEPDSTWMIPIIEFIMAGLRSLNDQKDWPGDDAHGAEIRLRNGVSIEFCS
ncbi:hypothetical protein Tco_0453960 [Tanacetum coccineum]